MNARITLTDIDRPREPLEVEVVESKARTMIVAVPGTIMEFQLRRSRDGAAFEGAIGGRYFRFDPSAPTTCVGAKGKPKTTKAAA
ncbi:hypothetical protein CQW49_22520 (plasmid) [Methylosinus trichosporium OB3b]|uniref:Uncharacterized protein n=1 Tax=Methylosinus trichosporium (strain ATCC 35070 / NCIMB 11131 / UNIQEM 75 / OB3b) TaxID=595536 RepID=A0A2D2D711_METT3|nr:hypothetical protein CQW49_22520 [Methylosinus trichosporium OB3b]